ncbi:hypothetical protein K458DRAFT_476585 [Lentithecium fluviatile CBS 122367]|uniref:Amino acid transporter n=1 Tax=Lentithecium fluviatile CBS 122367 TaxID=1168545 RepID=A0A6G1J8P1_9PLEO|nr:hypothetical protein K458DRAFT_476585 [Lentithecium fluviatile CBS 122367]
MEPTSTGSGNLKPRLSTLTMVGMSFAILNTWIARAGSLGLVMPSGSSVAFAYGFIFCVLCNLCIGASLGEMASIWPTAVTTEAFFSVQFFSAAGVVGSGGRYVPEAWKTYLIMVAISTYGMLVNALLMNMVMYWSITGVIVISIIILAMGDKNDADFVFTNFVNETGYTDGVAWILGLLQSVLSLIGYDAVIHMTDEMPWPRSDAPKAILLSIVVKGVTDGTAFILMLFSLTVQEMVFGMETGMAITELMYQATKSRAAAVVVTVMLGVCFINGTMGSMTSASRLVYAMARLDDPFEAITFTQIFDLCFGLLYLGPTIAFGVYTTSCTIFLNLSCAMRIAILLLRGRAVLTAHHSPAKPFTLGRWGYLCSIVSVVFVGVTTAMNYVSAMIGIFLVLLTTYWFVYGRRFEGPVSFL